ncbi:MAG: hypothetical protein Q8T04_12545, partial [Bacteroidota bacterium]|nr:hypothetical protein [Bacteroidota bacterium]
MNIDSLMNGTQSGKSLIFLLGTGLISTLAIIRLWSGSRISIYNMSIIDLLLFTFVLYILIQNNGAELIHSLLFLELVGLAILYFIIRQQN